MRKRIESFFHLYRREFVALAISIAAIATLLLFSGSFLNSVSAFLIRNQISNVDTVMNQEFNYLSQQREELIASKVFNTFLKKGDSLGLRTAAQREAKDRGLGFITMTDSNGFVLSRSHLPGQIGDNIFQTTPQGARIAQGETVTAVVRGVNNPLASISGSLILEEGKTIGGLVLGFIIDDSYAKRLQEKYFGSDSRILFYTNRRGIVGSSFDDLKILHLLDVFFSPGSDLITREVPQLERELKIDGKYYFARNIAFPGVNNSLGGAVVFLSVNHTLRCAGVAMFAVLIFLAVYWFLSRFRSLRREKRHPLVIALLAVVIFAATYATNAVRSDLASMELKDLPYPIYNSTLRFFPDSGIIHPLVETTVAIKVLTGGEAINNVRATIQYDPAKLKVVTILTSDSACSPDGFFQKTIDNKAGTVKINCIPQNVNPGFYKPEGTVAELVVLPLVEGDIFLTFGDKTHVLANDGFETDVLRSVTSAFFQSTRQGLTTLNIKDMIPVFSPSHPNSNRWYQSKNVQLTWPTFASGTYYYALNQIPDFTPSESDSSTTNGYLDTKFSKDGVYYFHLRGRDASGEWGPVSHLKIMEDSTPPLSPVIQSSMVKSGSGEIVRFNFSGEDEMSGVQKNFYVRFDNGIWFPMLPQLHIPFFKGEKHTVYLRVFDNAGNFSDSSVNVVAP